jgi:proline-specific peptidase
MRTYKRNRKGLKRSVKRNKKIIKKRNKKGGENPISEQKPKPNWKNIIIENKDKIRGMYLNTVCADSGVCIAFGQEKEKINKYFDDFVNFNYVNSIRRIGKNSMQGFVNEIECVRKHLGLEKFILLGHSFGTIFALDYALNYSRYLNGLILVSPLISIELFSRHMKKILSTYPERIQNIFIDHHRSSQSACRFELMEANLYHASLHVCRLAVWPELLLESSLNTNKALRDYMWGKIDFFLTGTTRHYERRHLLPYLSVKTLLCSGAFDLMDESDCCKFAEAIPNAEVSIIAGASHNPQFESPEAYGHALNQFIDGINFE